MTKFVVWRLKGANLITLWSRKLSLSLSDIARLWHGINFYNWWVDWYSLKELISIFFVVFMSRNQLKCDSQSQLKIHRNHLKTSGSSAWRKWLRLVIIYSAVDLEYFDNSTTCEREYSHNFYVIVVLGKFL